MEIKLTQIKQAINSFKMDELLQACYNYFDFETDHPKVLWVPLTIMKWTYLYGTRSYPVKVLTDKSFRDLFEAVMNFDPDHISNYMKQQGVHKAFVILQYQQFYLQTAVHRERFATQLKMYSIIKSRYDIAKTFKQKTKLSIETFIRILQIMWLYAWMNPSEYPKTKIKGYLSQPFMDILYHQFGKINTHNFIQLLMITPINAAVEAKKWNGTNKVKYENMERSFLTLFPFQ